MRIKEIMNVKPYVLRADNTLLKTLEFMRLENVSNLPVVDEKNKLIGLVTYREIVNGLAQGDIQKLLIRDIMAQNVVALEPDTPLKGAIEIMLINKCSCLPVVDKGRKLIGMVTEPYLLRTLYDVTSMPEEFYNVG